jgi:CRISPR-associated endonuclease/helicase Cas3
MNEPAKFWGHSRNDRGAGIAETVGDHLRRVSNLARVFATPLGLEVAAKVAAELHDIGKYSDAFNSYVQGVPGFPSPDHWSAGARLALAFIVGHEKSEPEMRDAIRLAIESHHSRLTCLDSTGESRVRLDHVINKSTRPISKELPKLVEYWHQDGFGQNSRSVEHLSRSIVGAMLDARMLFSCLVDSDFLATEAHFNGNSSDPYRPRDSSPVMDFAATADHIDRCVHLLRKSGTSFQSVRDELYQNSIDAAELSTGLFTLTAPTGSGKTLSMLQFALRHAAKNRLRRIVLVMPFLTIVDQVVRVIRDCLSQLPDYNPLWVLEDHSLADSVTDQESSEETNQPLIEQWRLTRRLMAENWDAPIVITSSVKCLESMHSDRISQCRKLHRIGESVVLFDEVQTLPPRLAVLTLATLSHLADRFNSTIVFATATQPAFDLLDKDEPPLLPQAWRVRDLTARGWQPIEIVKNSSAMFSATSGRVAVCWKDQEKTTFEKLASEVAKSRTSSLVIVNLKRHATELFRLLVRYSEDVFHLSTSMCAFHRQQTLDHIRKLLDAERPIRVVSTQCIEAGVDLSFGCGWRAYAPLDSIAQAAGRLNRSGERAQPSVLTVFRSDAAGTSYPPGYHAGVSALDALLAQLRAEGINPDDANIISSPEMIRRYYGLLYSLSDNTIMEEELRDGLEGLSFETVAKHYKLITTSQLNVLVPYIRTSFDKLVARFEASDRSPGWASTWFRDARPHTVSVYRQDFDKLASYLAPLPFGADEQRDPDSASWWYLLDSGSKFYDANTGLGLPEFGNALIL